MIFGPHGTVRLTVSELNILRRDNAKNGFAVNKVCTREELLEAALGGLPIPIQEELLNFIESGGASLPSRDDVPAA